MQKNDLQIYKPYKAKSVSIYIKPATHILATTMFSRINCHEIYLVICKETGKVVYVGQTALYYYTTRDGNVRNGHMKRWIAHVKSARLDNDKGCRVLCHAIRKYSSEAFVCLPYITVGNQDDANKWEEATIAEFETVSPKGYNIKLGGGNHRHHEETKKLISESQKGKVIPQEQRDKISASKKEPGMPRYVDCLNDSVNNQFGYQVVKCPGLADRQFTSLDNDEEVMNWQLQRAIDYAAGKDVPHASGDYDRGESWRAKSSDTRVWNLENTRAYSEYIRKSTSRDTSVFHVESYPGLPDTSFGAKTLSDDEKYQLCIDYIEGRIPPRGKAAKAFKPRDRGDRLPLYIFIIDEKHTKKMLKGYSVERHPTLPKKTFTTSTLTMEEKLQQAKDYLAGNYVERELPKNIYAYGDNGFKVIKHRKVPYKLFANTADTKEENLQRAIEHLTKYA